MKIALYAILSFILFSFISGCALIAGWKDSEEQDKLQAKASHHATVITPAHQAPIQPPQQPHPSVTAGKILNPLTQ